MQLSSGDHASLIAPSGQFRTTDRHLLDEGVAWLEGLGLRVAERVDHTHRFYLAGPDEVRAGHLNAALGDDECRAIFCTRGGYGAARLLRHIDRSLDPTPKFIVGHSDVTSLHLGLERIWPGRFVHVHGPNVATHQLLNGTTGAQHEANQASLRSVLFENAPLDQGVTFIRPGTGEGSLWGGCLSVLVTHVGTPYAVPDEGSILFVEDTGEAPFRIDRMVTHLRNAGALDRIGGLVFGAMVKCADPYNDLGEVILDALKGTTFPIAMGLPSGHGPVNVSMRLGTHVRMDPTEGTVRAVL